MIKHNTNLPGTLSLASPEISVFKKIEEQIKKTIFEFKCITGGQAKQKPT